MKTSVVIVYLQLTATVSCANAEKMKTIQEVKQSHEEELLAIPGVVSVGIGMGDKGHSAIIVGIAGTDAGAGATIPQSIEGYRVIVKPTGTVRAE